MLAQMPPLGRLLSAAGAWGLLGLACASAAAATAPIYKCLDRNLGVVYTDMPCQNGERMDLRAGDTDPAAVARLERERDALDRSSAQRIADERRAALQGRMTAATDNAAWYDTAPYPDWAGGSAYGYGTWAFAPIARNRSAEQRSDRRGARQQGVVPNRMPPLPR